MCNHEEVQKWIRGYEALEDCALRMAQDLREYAEAAEDAGEAIEATEELLAEFDRLMNDHQKAGLE